MNKTAIIAAAAAVAVAIGVVAAIQMQTRDTQPEFQAQTDTQSSPIMTVGDKVAIIETSQGNIEVEFFPNAAPRHVESFLTLAGEGFFDGVLFHRIVPGFVIQGGDPLSKDLSARNVWGTGGPGYFLDQEFNSIPHSRGIVSMARSNDPNSAGSQFFIVLRDSNFLDRQYTVFGRVLEGMDVVDRIAALETVGGSGPTSQQPAHPDEARIISIRIVSR